MANYFVGDVQGCHAALCRLLDDVAFDPARDVLWSVGDLVNRGPDSLAVLRLFHGLGNAARVVLGNHDLHLLAVAGGHQKHKKSDTLRGILDAPDRDELLTWLRHRPLLIHDQTLGTAMVHAGLPPSWDVATARRLAGEVECALREHPDGFFAHMYGNEPARWSEQLGGQARLRYITNALTRLRFCTADDRLDLITKDSRHHPDPAFLPWFAHPHRRSLGQRIVFGHWAALEGEILTQDLISLDTGCVWGDRLRLWRLEDGALFHCDCGHDH